MATYKIAICGAGGVGKSSLTMMYIQGDFDNAYDPTVEDSYRKEAVIDGDNCLLDITDTAGQEEYAAMRSTYMRGSDGFLIVYAVNSNDSWEEVYVFRNQILKSKDVDTCPIVIVANKCDLPAGDHTVALKMTSEKAKEWGHPIMEASAKDNKNVDESFAQVVRLIAGREAVETDKKKGGGKKAKNAGPSSGGAAASGGGGTTSVDVDIGALGLTVVMFFCWLFSLIAMASTSWMSECQGSICVGFGLTRACAGSFCVDIVDSDDGRLKAGSLMTFFIMLFAFFVGLITLGGSVLTALDKEFPPLTKEIRQSICLFGGATMCGLHTFAFLFYGLVVCTIDNAPGPGYSYVFCILVAIASGVYTGLIVVGRKGMVPQLSQV